MIFTMHNCTAPDWVMDNIMKICPYCNSMIVDNSDGPSGMTIRFCPNKKCPGHMQHKMNAVAKKLGVKNFGPATALSYIKSKGCESHLDILPIWLGDTKPIMKLSDIAEIACIEGYSAVTGRKELNDYNSFEDYFNRARPLNPILYANRELLMRAEKYFTVPKALSSRKMFVMGHGSFNNFSSRSEFFEEVNDAYGSIIQVIETGKRKTGISYLIMEETAAKSGGKYSAAKEAGVPIVTPVQFLNILDGYLHN